MIFLHEGDDELLYIFDTLFWKLFPKGIFFGGGVMKYWTSVIESKNDEKLSNMRVKNWIQNFGKIHHFFWCQ